MKILWAKERVLWAVAAILGLSAMMAASVQDVRASVDTNYTTSDYILIRTDEPVDTVNDRMIWVSQKRRGELVITTGTFNAGGTKPFCGTKCDDAGCLSFSTDPNYGGLEYYGGHTLRVRVDNAKPARIPRAMYVKTEGNRRPGKLLRNLTAVTDGEGSNTCYLIDTTQGVQTYTFHKYLGSVE